MTTLPTARHVEPFGGSASDSVTLDYAARFLRRRVLTTDTGQRVLVDLEQTTSLNAGDALVLDDGPRIRVMAAQEDVLRVRGANLTRLAWHIGNRHTPCQIETDHVVIAADPVIAHMLEHLGAEIEAARAPFTPEGGAYGHGRTHAHAHGHSAHD
ncbi:urease accessory protein UreE [Salipiger sp. IMCC34102]|uniref:urease accessory protein UreE n=1 Tax=Salipiger sp. IMCC34102 TaxID=2510647 RepID=UPI00101DA30A|nr:urease accessory protein UreE [Salipiger sp. IMCC34102]RYH01271.1 urease accessory protein UreE [Salipiger sp. IMCC34102]